MLGQFEYCADDFRNLKLVVKEFRGRKYIYIGQLRPGTKRAEGVGIRVWNDGDIEEGYFQQDLLNGRGRSIKSNGDYALGEFRDNNIHLGILNYVNGDVYDGKFVNGIKEGWGTMTYKDGTKKRGDWKNDEFQK